MLLIWICFGSDDDGDHRGKPSSEMGQYLRDVVAAGAEGGKECVAEGALGYVIHLAFVQGLDLVGPLPFPRPGFRHELFKHSALCSL